MVGFLGTLNGNVRSSQMLLFFLPLSVCFSRPQEERGMAWSVMAMRVAGKHACGQFLAHQFIHFILKVFGAEETEIPANLCPFNFGGGPSAGTAPGGGGCLPTALHGQASFPSLTHLRHLRCRQTGCLSRLLPLIPRPHSWRFWVPFALPQLWFLLLGLYYLAWGLPSWKLLCFLLRLRLLLSILGSGHFLFVSRCQLWGLGTMASCPLATSGNCIW